MLTSPASLRADTSFFFHPVDGVSLIIEFRINPEPVLQAFIRPDTHHPTGQFRRLICRVLLARLMGFVQGELYLEHPPGDIHRIAAVSGVMRYITDAHIRRGGITRSIHLRIAGAGRAEFLFTQL